MRPSDGSHHRLVIQRAQRSQVDHFRLDARGGKRLRRLKARVQAAAIGNECDIAAGTPHGCPLDVDPLEAGREVAFHVVERNVLEDQRGIRAGEGSGQHSTRVVDRRRGKNAEPRDVGVPAFETVRVLSGELAARSGRHADHERYVELSARHVADRRSVVQDLVQRQQTEVDSHDLDDGPQAAERGPDARTHESGLRQRRVAKALGAEFLEQPLGDGEAAAVSADVLAHQERA